MQLHVGRQLLDVALKRNSGADATRHDRRNKEVGLGSQACEVCGGQARTRLRRRVRCH